MREPPTVEAEASWIISWSKGFQAKVICAPGSRSTGQALSKSPSAPPIHFILVGSAVPHVGGVVGLLGLWVQGLWGYCVRRL
ncbi:hypothetical protein FKM82_025204 [Ascaphus truei]